MKAVRRPWGLRATLGKAALWETVMFRFYPTWPGTSSLRAGQKGRVRQ